MIIIIYIIVVVIIILLIEMVLVVVIVIPLLFDGNPHTFLSLNLKAEFDMEEGWKIMD